MIENRLIDEEKLENYLGGKDYSSLRIRQQRDKAIHVAFEANCTRFSLIGPGRRPSIGRKSKLNERNCRTILPFFSTVTNSCRVVNFDSSNGRKTKNKKGEEEKYHDRPFLHLCSRGGMENFIRFSFHSGNKIFQKLELRTEGFDWKK